MACTVLITTTGNWQVLTVLLCSMIAAQKRLLVNSYCGSGRFGFVCHRPGFSEKLGTEQMIEMFPFGYSRAS